MFTIAELFIYLTVICY